MIRNLARRFADEVLAPVALEYDEKEEIPWDVVREAHRLGLMNLDIPVAYGGQGLDFFTTCIVMEELATGCAGIMHTLEANSLMARPLLLYGSEEQKRAFLLPHCREPRLGALALTEPEHGSDVTTLSTRAEFQDDSYIINGRKCFITNGGVADLYTVFPATDPSQGPKGLSCFVVPGNQPGLSGGRKERKMGLRSSHTADVIFDGVRVPPENLVGLAGQGYRIAMDTLEVFRILAAAGSVGIARSALEKACRYAGQRQQFGRPIGSNQAIQVLLADMGTAVEAARLLVWRAAWLADQGRADGKLAAMAKTYASDTAMKVTTDAVQIFGGYGYMRDYGIEKLMRDAKVGQIYEGTNQIQRLIVARELLKEHEHA
ncbi:MAG: acyl-CoA dehydrogenase [Clostridia bacterium]|nr:MAG: acyl-CoA dehydrogenase [Clostridia bacterium]